MSSYCYTDFIMLTLFSTKTLRATRKTIAVATLIIFLFLALASLNSGVHMEMDGTGMMADCPFMIWEDSLCQMTVSEHVEHWQNVISGIIQYGSWLASGLAFFFFLRSLFGFSSRQKWRHVLSLKYHFRPLWRSYLSQAFSDGILHPKRDNLVTV